MVVEENSFGNALSLTYLLDKIAKIDFQFPSHPTHTYPQYPFDTFPQLPFSLALVLVLVL